MKYKQIFNLLQKSDEYVDFKKPDVSKQITKRKLKEETEEFEDDELEEEKENEYIGEDGKMSVSACSLVKDMNRTGS